MSHFRLIEGPPPVEAEERVAPFHGLEVLVAVDIACTLIVRNGWWDDGDRWDEKGHESREEATGWWAYRNSVTQEKLEGIYEPTHWAPMPDGPEDLI